MTRLAQEGLTKHQLCRARFRQTLLVQVEIAEDETFSLDHLAHSAADRLGKAWARIDEGVEFAPLAARVDVGGQLGEQAFVVLPTGERAVELLRIDADELGAKAGGDEFARKASRVSAPERKESALALASE